MTIELDSTLAQAEVLFLSFLQIVADIDKRRAEISSAAGGDTVEIRRRRKGKEVAGTDQVQTVTLPVISENLRELLAPGS